MQTAKQTLIYAIHSYRAATRDGGAIEAQAMRALTDWR